jgi:hypothetical protein
MMLLLGVPLLRCQKYRSQIMENLKISQILPEEIGLSVLLTTGIKTPIKNYNEY